MTEKEDRLPARVRSRRLITGDSRLLRNGVIVLLLLLAGAILVGVGMIAIDLSNRAAVQWKSIQADFNRSEPARDRPEAGDAPFPKDRVDDAAPAVAAPAAISGFAELTAARPLTSPATWLGPDDYPVESLRREEEGAVGVAYVVGTDGRVETCVVERSSGFPRLDSRTCALVTSNGRFTPALDSAGKPTKGRGRLRFRWQIAE